MALTRWTFFGKVICLLLNILSRLVITFLPSSKCLLISWVQYIYTHISMGYPGGSDDKQSACDMEHLGSIPGLGRSPGGGHGSPLQYSCLENAHGQRSLVGYHPWGRRVRHDCLTNTKHMQDIYRENAKLFMRLSKNLIKWELDGCHV